jgi:hypothetical protein
MLRVSYSYSAEEQRWHLCGRLAGKWVDELRSCWRSCVAPHARAILDLTDVTFIDEAGEELLSEMHTAGLEFVAAGVENKDLLEGLKQNGRRPVRRLVGNSHIQEGMNVDQS